MNGELRAYGALFRLRMAAGLHYRSSVFGEVICRFIWIFMEILAYHALFRAAPNGFPLGLEQTVSYVWLQQTTFVLFKIVFSDNEIYDSINSGGIAYELVRPMGLYERWFYSAAANRLSYTLVNALPVIAVGLLLPPGWGLAKPATLSVLGLSFVSAALGLGTTAAVALLMFNTLFITISHRGIKIIFTAVTDFLSGGVIPLVFFPSSIRRLVQLSPFAAMRDTPLAIYTGSYTFSQSLAAMGLQLFWLVVLVLLGKFWMKRLLNRLVVQGG